MYFNFPCPHCGKRLKVQEEQAGRNVRCPYCKNGLTIPDPGAAGGGSEPTPTGLPNFGAAPPNAARDSAPTAPSTSTPASPAAPAFTPATASSKRSAKPRSGGKRAASQDDGTNASLVWTALCGLLLTAVFYAALAPVPKVYFRDLFYDRGWVTIAETFFMFWAIAILVAKSRKLMRQRESMLFDLLPESFGRDITLQNVGQFADYVQGLPVDTKAGFLTRRVVRGLEHYSVRGSAAEVSTMLSSQSELDNNAVASSYSLLNVFIWAIPILGFIGTVQGLGDAVGNLSGSLEAASDVESIKKSLGAITGGLGVAFDTTLVALIMSLFLKFPASSLQKAEEDLLNWVEDYTNENLLKRLVDVAAEPTDSNEAVMQRAIHAALAPHHAELRTWSSKLREIGQQLSADVAAGWTDAQRGLQQQHAEQFEQFSAAVRTLGEVAARTSEATERLQQTHELIAARSTADDERRASASQQATDRFVEQLGQMREAVQNLNETLGQLDGKQVQIETRPRKRSWFGRR